MGRGYAVIPHRRYLRSPLHVNCFLGCPSQRPVFVLVQMFLKIRDNYLKFLEFLGNVNRCKKVHDVHPMDVTGQGGHHRFFVPDVDELVYGGAMQQFHPSIAEPVVRRPSLGFFERVLPWMGA